MTEEDEENFKKPEECHICNKKYNVTIAILLVSIEDLHIKIVI